MLDLESKAERRTITQRVTEVGEAEVIFNGGGLTLDRLGNMVKTPDGRRFTPRQDMPLEFAVGKKWNTRFSVTSPGGSISLEFVFRIVGREKVTVPAGSFDCFVIIGKASGWDNSGAVVETRETRWMAPDRARQPVATDLVRKTLPRRGAVIVHQSERFELIAFNQS